MNREISIFHLVAAYWDNQNTEGRREILSRENDLTTIHLDGLSVLRFTELSAPIQYRVARLLTLGASYEYPGLS